MRICIFCSAIASSKEHAWPQWVVDAIGTRPGFRIDFWQGEGKQRTWEGTGRGAHIQVRRVCSTCNNGWMSSLESRAQLTLRPLMNDVSIPLDRDDQALIALWSMKTAMVFESAAPVGHWFYTAAERANLKDAGELPIGTMAWIGRFARNNVSFAHAKRLLGPRTDVGRVVVTEGYVTTLALARVVIQILTIRRAAEGETPRVIVHGKPGPWRESLLQVWRPKIPMRWPPERSFTEEQELDDLCARFTNPGETRRSPSEWRR